MDIEKDMEYIDSLELKNGWYGWYSKKQKKYGTTLDIKQKCIRNQILPKSNIYLTIGGQEVEVTEVIPIDINLGIYKESLYPDAIYRGIVVKWLRHIYD